MWYQTNDLRERIIGSRITQLIVKNSGPFEIPAEQRGTLPKALVGGAYIQCGGGGPERCNGHIIDCHVRGG